MASANGPERLAEAAESLLTPDDSEPESHSHPIPRRPTWIERPSHVYHVAKATALRVNIRLFWVFVPLGIVTGAANVHAIVVSIFNFLAIIPLSAIVSGLSDKLSDEFGDLLGALINATFGNAVELSARPLLDPSVYPQLMVTDRYSGSRPRGYSLRPDGHAWQHLVRYPLC